MFDEILVRPIINALLAIYQVLHFLNIPYELSFAIILLTILIRFLLYPLMATQLKASKKMQDLNPHISHLKQKHKGDAKRLQQETMRLYKEHGVNPFSGCLPLLVQLPLFYALYSALQKAVTLQGGDKLSAINDLAYSPFLKLSSPWDLHFLGIPLGQNPSQLILGMPFIILVPVITGVLQFIQSKMMFSPPASTNVQLKKSAPSKEPDFASAFQSQSLYILPIMIGFFSYTFPIGLSLYWNTFTLFGILQQYRIQGLGGLESWVKKLPQQTKR